MNYWPIWVACSLMGLAAVIQLRARAVPNRLSYSSIFAGWIAALMITAMQFPMTQGSIVSSISASLIGGALLLPFWIVGMLGGGCVKIQIGFGAWVGCALSASAAALAVTIATIAGAVATAIGVRIAISCASRVCNSERPRVFPAQLTLSLGSVCGLVAVLFWT